jgi:uncharacterized protein
LQRILEGNPTLCATIRADQIKRLPVGNRCCAAKKNILHKIGGFINQSADSERRYTENATMQHLSVANIRDSHPAMKLQPTVTKQYQTVTGYDDSGVEINAVQFNYSLVVLPEVEPVAWPVASFDALTAEHFAQIDAIDPDVVILGTGRKQRFVHPRLTSALTTRRIGVECMDNQAACRTYNILMAEGRKVVLALIIEHQS